MWLLKFLPLILHTSLSIGCSSLNSDLFLKNITDLPLCCWGSIENTQHYFSHCRLYEAPHVLLLNSVEIYQTP